MFIPSIDKLTIDIEQSIDWLNNYDCSNLPDRLIIAFAKTRDIDLKCFKRDSEKLNIIKTNRKKYGGNIQFQKIITDVKLSVQKNLDGFLIAKEFFIKTDEFINQFGADKICVIPEWDNVYSIVLNSGCLE
jgi:hypothetical protein